MVYTQGHCFIVVDRAFVYFVGNFVRFEGFSIQLRRSQVTFKVTKIGPIAFGAGQYRAYHDG